MQYELYPLGEQGVVIRWNGGISEAMQQIVTDAMYRLEHGRSALPAVLELVRAYCTVTVYYDPLVLYLSESRQSTFRVKTSDENRGIASPLGGRTYTEVEEQDLRSPYEIICQWIHANLDDSGAVYALNQGLGTERMLEVPVCFGGACGPDLDDLARSAGMSTEEAIRLYCSVTYRVHMIGFIPGFPYMGGLPEQLAAPRRSEPRLSVPVGSVGIAGLQTGIYPLAIPGGWQLIGRTPLQLFEPLREPPSMFLSGDCVRFQPISEKEFAQQLAEVR